MTSRPLPAPPRPPKPPITKCTTPNKYKHEDFPTLPFDGWLKPCYYNNCYAITGERVIVRQYSIPCCRTCKKRCGVYQYFVTHFADNAT